MMAYKISIKQFDGPLDLLLHLIEKAELDIRDVFVSEITSQYLEYVYSAEDLDLDTASDFLTMAARLMYIKSRSLLPKPPRETDEEEEDPEELLIRQLREYKAYKQASQMLSELEKDASKVYTKLPEEFILPPKEVIFTGGTPTELYYAFCELLHRAEQGGARDNKALTHEVTPDIYTVRGCMAEIRQMLREKDGECEFFELFEDDAPKLKIIVMFMALLEMLLRQEIAVNQSKTFGKLHIKALELKDGEAYENEKMMDEVVSDE